MLFVISGKNVHFTNIFQNGTTKWMEKQPLVYFPLGHDISTYQLIVNSSLMKIDYSGDNFHNVIPNTTQLTQKINDIFGENSVLYFIFF